MKCETKSSLLCAQCTLCWLSGTLSRLFTLKPQCGKQGSSSTKLQFRNYRRHRAFDQWSCQPLGVFPQLLLELRTTHQFLHMWHIWHAALICPEWHIFLLQKEHHCIVFNCHLEAVFTATSNGIMCQSHATFGNALLPTCAFYMRCHTFFVMTKLQPLTCRTKLDHDCAQADWKRHAFMRFIPDTGNLTNAWPFQDETWNDQTPVSLGFRSSLNWPKWYWEPWFNLNLKWPHICLLFRSVWLRTVWTWRRAESISVFFRLAQIVTTFDNLSVSYAGSTYMYCWSHATVATFNISITREQFFVCACVCSLADCVFVCWKVGLEKSSEMHRSQSKTREYVHMRPFVVWKQSVWTDAAVKGTSRSLPWADSDRGATSNGNSKVFFCIS